MKTRDYPSLHEKITSDIFFSLLRMFLTINDVRGRDLCHRGKELATRGSLFIPPRYLVENTQRFRGPAEADETNFPLPPIDVIARPLYQR